MKTTEQLIEELTVEIDYILTKANALLDLIHFKESELLGSFAPEQQSLLRVQKYAIQTYQEVLIQRLKHLKKDKEDNNT